MNRIFILFSLLLLLFSGCHKEETESQPLTKVRRTVIVYMAAENSLNTYVMGDSIEMVDARKQIPEDVNFIIYKDGIAYPAIHTLSAKDGIRLWKKFDSDQDSTDSLTMRNTLREIIRMFPADSYGLVLWSHGNGWVPRKGPSKRSTFGIDNNSNTTSNSGHEMNIEELRGALEEVAPLDYILFDACFMQSVEVAYQLRDVVKYTIGSPAEIPGNGAPYNLIMNDLCEANVQNIVQNYYDFYSHTYGVALSAVDCSKLDKLAQCMKPLVNEIWSGKVSRSTNGIQYYGPFSSESNWRPEPFDIKSVMHNMLSADRLQEFDEALDEVLLASKATNKWTSIYSGLHNTLTDKENYSGLSMFIPHSKYNGYGWNEAFQSTEWYKVAGWDTTGW